MRSDNSQDYRFRMNSDIPQSYLQENAEENRIKRLSRRFTILAILLPCLIGAISFWGYRDLKKGVSSLRSTDAVETRKLSEELDSKYSSISIQVATLEESLGKIQGNFNKLEASFNKKVLPLNEIYLVFEKTTKALKDNIRNTEKTIEQLKSSKSNASDVAKAITAVEKKFSPVSLHLKNMEAEIKALDENLTQELAELSGSISKVKSGLKQFEALKKEINKFGSLKKDLTKLAAKQIDPKSLDKRLSKERQSAEKELRSLRAELKSSASQIEALEGHVQELMKFKALSEIKMRLAPRTETPKKSPPADTTGSSKAPKTETQPTGSKKATAPKSPPPPKPGTIQEETLR